MSVSRSVSLVHVTSSSGVLLAFGALACNPPCEEGFGKAADGNCYPITEDTGDTGSTDTGDTADDSDSGDTSDTGDTAATGPERWLLGDLTISTSTAAAAFCTQYDAVHGNVSIEGGQLLNLDALACLVEVDGSLVIRAWSLQTVDLPQLANVSAGVAISTSDTTTAVELPVLETVGDDLVLGPELNGVTVIDVHQVTAVGGDLIVDVDNIATLDLGAVETVGGKLKVQTGEYMTSLSMAALTDVGGDLDVGNLDLSEANFQALEAVGGDFEFSASGLVTMNGFTGLRTIGGTLRVNNNQALTDITGLYGLTSVGSDLVIEANPHLPTSQATALVEAIQSVNIGGVVVIANNGPG